MNSATHKNRRLAFTLLEVMIAVMILFMCLFAVLALLSNSLRSARKLQQHRSLDMGSVAGQAYAQLVNTQQVNAGPFELDLKDTFPDFKCENGDVEPAGSNGLCTVDYDIMHNGRLEQHSQFLIYLPNMKQGMSQSLRSH